MKFDEVKKEYDIIIIGCGLSGITLALELNSKTDKSVLILEKKEKLEKDKSWCFWNYPINPFTNNYDHKWNKIKIKSKNYEIIKSHKNYSYRHVYSNKLYDLIQDKSLKSEKLDIFFSQDIEKIEKINGKNFIKLKNNNKLISSRTVFDSRPPEIKKNQLVQHFLGIELESNKDIFDSTIITLMDFSHSKSNIHFFYILPFTSKRALIETTYLSTNVFKKEKYIVDIENYIQEKYPNVRFKKKFIEQGVIPMYQVKSEANSHNVIKIGTANNWVRKSSGYAFQNSFINSKIIVNQILNNKPIKIKKKWSTIIMDKLFCLFLQKFPKESTNLFMSFFENLQLDIIVKFLTDTNSLLDSLKVILALPKYKMLYCVFFILKK